MDGIRLALAADEGRLAIQDTVEEVASGVAAFAALSADPSVVAVVGPLSSSVAEAVAPRAESTRLPLLLLSQREGLSGAVLLQTAMTRSLQAETLSAYAIRQLGWPRIEINKVILGIASDHGLITPGFTVVSTVERDHLVAQLL